MMKGLFAIILRREFFNKMTLDTAVGAALQGFLIQSRFPKPFIFNMFHIFYPFTDRLDSGENPLRAKKYGHYGYPHLWRNLWIIALALWRRFSGSQVSLESVISLA